MKASWHSSIMKSEAWFSGLIMLLSLFMLCAAYPYVFDRFLPIPPVKIMVIFFFFLFGTIIVLLHKVKPLPKILTYFFSLQVFVWIIYWIYHDDNTYMLRVIYLSNAYMCLLCLHNTSRGLLSFAKFYNNFILFMAIGGLITVFLVFFLSFEPMFVYENTDGRFAYFFGLTTTNVYLVNMIRYAGFFDEPGAMAYWGIFALLINKLFVGNLKYEKWLIICLLFTFSLAFYIQIMVYYILFPKWTTKKVFLAMSVFMLVAFSVYQLKDSEYSVVYKLTLGRLEFDQRSDTFEGDNRSELMLKARKKFESAPIMGIGEKKFLAEEYMADNPYEIPAKDGLIGLLITYLPLFILLLMGKLHKYFFFAAIIFALGYLQRPFHVDIVHAMMLYLVLSLSLLYYPISK